MRKGEASPHFANDPYTQDAWLPSRTCSHSGMRRLFSTLWGTRGANPRVYPAALGEKREENLRRCASERRTKVNLSRTRRYEVKCRRNQMRANIWMNPPGT